jgi:hypothetical protein
MVFGGKARLLAAQLLEMFARLAQLDLDGANTKPDQRRLEFGSPHGFARGPAHYNRMLNFFAMGAMSFRI